jgi:hypothetical protein
VYVYWNHQRERKCNGVVAGTTIVVLVIKTSKRFGIVLILDGIVVSTGCVFLATMFLHAFDLGRALLDSLDFI